MPTFTNVNGVWREVSQTYTNVNGTWRSVNATSTNVNGVWRSVEDPFGLAPYVVDGNHSSITKMDDIRCICHLNRDDGQPGGYVMVGTPLKKEWLQAGKIEASFVYGLSKTSDGQSYETAFMLGLVTKPSTDPTPNEGSKYYSFLSPEQDAKYPEIPQIPQTKQLTMSYGVKSNMTHLIAGVRADEKTKAIATFGRLVVNGETVPFLF